MSAEKRSALAAMAADLGSSVPHTPAGPENPEGDLLRDLDGELSLFADQAIKPPVKRGAGRPPGSPNRSTLQLQRLLMARGYRDPAEFLAAIVTADPRELARDLGGKADVRNVTFDEALEVAKLQKGAASELLPYFHQRMPQAVHHTGDAARPLIMIMDGPGAASGVRLGDAMSVHDLQPIQQVSEGEPQGSHDGGSHDDD